MTAVERWLPTPGYEGIYEVSDHGRVRGVDRYVTRRDARPGSSAIFIAGRILSQQSTRTGHKTVGLYKSGKGRTFLVHHLVLSAFVGPMPEGLEGCHNNGDPADNRLTNLRWDTRASNCLDTLKHGRRPETKRTHCPRRHLLSEPNIRAGEAARGNRACLACSRARAAQQRAELRGEPFDFTSEADRRYAQIIAESA
jgi:hypothetical protein